LLKPAHKKLAIDLTHNSDLMKIMQDVCVLLYSDKTLVKSVAVASPN
jgi:hypothetical protein